MSHEQLPGDYPPSPELLAHVGEITVVCTWENTQINLYYPPWHTLGHVAIADERLPYDGRRFHDAVLANRCQALDYPMRLARRPSQPVIDAYIDYQADRLLWSAE